MTDRSGETAMGLIVGAVCGISVVLCFGAQTSCGYLNQAPKTTVTSQPKNVTVEDGAIYVRVISGGDRETAAYIEKLESELQECRHAQEDQGREESP